VHHRVHNSPPPILEDYCRLGCDIVWSGRHVPTFEGNLLPPSSGHRFAFMKEEESRDFRSSVMLHSVDR